MGNPGHAYNELGQILAAGGEIHVAQEASGGLLGAALLGYLLGRYTKTPDYIVAELAEFGEAMADAGSIISGMDPADKIDLSSLPVNPELFGDSPAGRRYKVGIDIYQPDLGVNITVHVDAAGTMTTAELIAEAEKMAQSIRESYPEKFKPDPDIEPTDRPPQILWAERRF